MIAAAFFGILGMQVAGAAGAPVSGDCSKDPEALVERAESLLTASPGPAEEAIARARSLLRSARRSGRSAVLDLRASDLAFSAGDAEEGGDLLAAAAEADPRLALSPAELSLLARRAEERRRWREAIQRYDALRRALATSARQRPGSRRVSASSRSKPAQRRSRRRRRVRRSRRVSLWPTASGRSPPGTSVSRGRSCSTPCACRRDTSRRFSRCRRPKRGPADRPRR